MKCAFIGLGVMGYPMAGHLQKNGFTTTVYNRTSKKAEQWVEEFGGSMAETPREAVVEADVVLVCVGNDEDVRSVFYGDEGLLASISETTIVIDHTTASAELARELADEVHQRIAVFLDAPVSGGEQGAINGVLTAMIGGDKEAFDDAQPVLECYCKTREYMGLGRAWAAGQNGEPDLYCRSRSGLSGRAAVSA